jgi:hypothetical protein
VSKRTKFLLGIGVIAALVIGWQIAAFAILPGSNFEGNDGNLADGSGANDDVIDWNSFAPLTWQGQAPDRTATKGPNADTSNWKVLGLEDPVAGVPDDGFSGGTKQDADCATVKSASNAPDKDDLERIYLATKTTPVGTQDHTFLALAWVRAHLNTITSSTHVGYEFNKFDGLDDVTGQPSAAELCNINDPNGLVKRSTGDMLVVYDFDKTLTGNAPSISIRRWVTTGAGTQCDVAKNVPCWSTPQTLGANATEAAVNTEDASGAANPVVDAIAPVPPDTLDTNEFGEAVIDLTAAGVFTQGQCAGFGQVGAVSRTSGETAKAAIKDLVGPRDFSLNNCGQLTIIKQTSPRGINQEFKFSASANFTGSTLSCDETKAGPPAETPTSFSLNDNGNSGQSNSAANTNVCTNVSQGTYTFTELAPPDNPSNYDLTISCNNSGGSQTGARTASITVTAGSNTTCTFTNTQQKGAIAITKTTKDASTPLVDNDPQSGVTFTVKKGTPPNQTTVASAQTNSAGKVCFGNLDSPADYTVTETVPNGYQLSGTNDRSANVSTNATCNADGTASADAATLSFQNIPLSSIQVKFTSLAGAGKTASSIVCADSTGNITDAARTTEQGAADGAFDDTDETFTNLIPGTSANPAEYTCTIKVDP